MRAEPIAWSFEGLLGRFIGKEGGSSEGKKDVFLAAGKRMLLRLRQCLSEGHPCKMKSHQKLFTSYSHQPLFALLLGAGFLIGGLSQSQRLHGEILVHDTFDGGPGALLNQSEATGWLHTSGTICNKPRAGCSSPPNKARMWPLLLGIVTSTTHPKTSSTS